MPRQARLDSTVTLHHVIIWGIEKKKIVDDKHDRSNLLTRMGDLAQETGGGRRGRISKIRSSTGSINICYFQDICKRKVIIISHDSQQHPLIILLINLEALYMIIKSALGNMKNGRPK